MNKSGDIHNKLHKMCKQFVAWKGASNMKFDMIAICKIKSALYKHFLRFLNF